MLENWLLKLKSGGYRLTAPRRAIVEIVLSSSQILSPQEIYLTGKKLYPGLGLVTVYRTLEKLEELGLVQRVHQPDGCHRILPAASGHQHVLLCTLCGRAVYFSGDDLSELFQEISAGSGYQIESHILQLFGRCSGCQAGSAGTE